MSDFKFFEYNETQLPCFKNEDNNMWMVPLCAFQSMIAPEGDTDVIERELENIFPNAYKMKSEEMKKMRAFLDRKNRSDEYHFETSCRERKPIKLAAPLALLKKNGHFLANTSKSKEPRMPCPNYTNHFNNNNHHLRDHDMTYVEEKHYSSGNSHFKLRKKPYTKAFYHSPSPARSSSNPRYNLTVSSCSDDALSESEQSNRFYSNISSRNKVALFNTNRFEKKFVPNDSFSKSRKVETEHCVFEHVMEDFERKKLSEPTTERHIRHRSSSSDHRRRRHREVTPSRLIPLRSRSRSNGSDKYEHRVRYRRNTRSQERRRQEYINYRHQLRKDTKKAREKVLWGKRLHHERDRRSTGPFHFRSFRSGDNFKYKSTKPYTPIRRGKLYDHKKSSRSKSKSPKITKPQKELPRIAGEKSALISAKNKRKSTEKSSPDFINSSEVNSQIPDNVSDLVTMMRKKADNHKQIEKVNKEPPKKLAPKKTKKGKSNRESTNETKQSEKLILTEDAIKKKYTSGPKESSSAPNVRNLSSNSAAKSDTTVDSGIDEKCDDIVIAEKSIKMLKPKLNQPAQVKWPLQISACDVDSFLNFDKKLFLGFLFAPSLETISSVSEKIRNEFEFNNFNSQIGNSDVLSKSELTHTAKPQTAETLKKHVTENNSNAKLVLPVEKPKNAFDKTIFNQNAVASLSKEQEVNKTDDLGEISTVVTSPALEPSKICQIDQVEHNKIDKDLQKQPLSWKKAMLEKAKQHDVFNTLVDYEISQNKISYENFVLNEPKNRTATLNSKRRGRKRKSSKKVVKESSRSKKNVDIEILPPFLRRSQRVRNTLPSISSDDEDLLQTVNNIKLDKSKPMEQSDDDIFTNENFQCADKFETSSFFNVGTSAEIIKDPLAKPCGLPLIANKVGCHQSLILLEEDKTKNDLQSNSLKTFKNVIEPISKELQPTAAKEMHQELVNKSYSALTQTKKKLKNNSIILNEKTCPIKDSNILKDKNEDFAKTSKNQNLSLEILKNSECNQKELVADYASCSETDSCKSNEKQPTPKTNSTNSTSHEREKKDAPLSVSIEPPAPALETQVSIKNQKSNKASLVTRVEPFVKLNRIQNVSNLNQVSSDEQILLEKKKSQPPSTNLCYHGIMEIDMEAPVAHFLKYLTKDHKSKNPAVVTFIKRRIPYVQIKKGVDGCKPTNGPAKHDTTLVRVRDVAFVLKRSLMYVWKQIAELGILVSPAELQFILDVYGQIYGRHTIDDSVLLHCMGYLQPQMIEAEYLISLDSFLNRLIPKMFETSFRIPKGCLSKFVSVRTYQPINYITPEVTKIFSKSFLYNINLIRSDVMFDAQQTNSLLSLKPDPSQKLVVLKKPEVTKKRKQSIEKKTKCLKPKKPRLSRSRNQSLESNSSTENSQLNQKATVSTHVGSYPNTSSGFVTNGLTSYSKQFNNALVTANGTPRLSLSQNLTNNPVSYTFSSMPVILGSATGNSTSFQNPMYFPMPYPVNSPLYPLQPVQQHLQQQTKTNVLINKPQLKQLTLGEQFVTNEETKNLAASTDTIPTYEEFAKYFMPTAYSNVNNSSNHLDEQVRLAYKKHIQSRLQAKLAGPIPHKGLDNQNDVDFAKSENANKFDHKAITKTEPVENESFYKNFEKTKDNSDLKIDSVFTIAGATDHKETSQVTTSEFFTNTELRKNKEDELLEKDASTVVSKLSHLKKVLVEAELAVNNVSNEMERKTMTKNKKKIPEPKSNLSEVVKKLEQRIGDAP